MRPILALVLVHASIAAADPYLAFSDLASGPRTGCTDTSLGAPAGRDGAIVSIWGAGLGDAQGSSSVRCGGAPAAKVYYWGPAKPPWSPADLAASHGLQLVVFQVSADASDGPGEITVAVDGVVSNALPFTVRAGSIYFVRPTGDDTGPGTWSAPWRTMPHATASVAPGDTIYVDTMAQTDEAGDRAALSLDVDGTAAMPIALVAYPGSTVDIGSSTLAALSSFISGLGYATNWTIAKVRLTAQDDAVGMSTGFRVVGNHVTAPLGDQPTGAISGSGDHLRILGNELTGVGKPNASKLYHPIYLQGARASSGPRLPTETDREVAWNSLHDNNAPDGINIYSEDSSSAFITDHRVHHNVIRDQVGEAILVGYYACGETWVYGNLIVRAGLGPEPTGDPATHYGVEIDAGHEAFTGSVVHFLANTIVDCGWTGAAQGAGATGALGLFSPARYRLEFGANIVVANPSGYVGTWSDDFPARAGGNLWWDGGAPPAWDTTAISADPLFIDRAADQRLRPGSPAIDAASSLPAAIDRDLDGARRPTGAGWDFGAYEVPAGGATTTGSSTTSGSTTGGSTTGGSMTGGAMTGGSSATTGSSQGAGGSGHACGHGASIAVAALLAMSALRARR